MAVHSLMMRSSMPGRWPVEMRNHDDEVQLSGSPMGISQQRQISLPWPLTTQISRPRGLEIGVTRQQTQVQAPDAQDELFLDWPLRDEPVTNEEVVFSSPLFTHVEVYPDTLDDTDWRSYEPPQELFHSTAGQSAELESILRSSIERVQARHREEEERRVAAARSGRPLARAGRASVNPLRRVPVVAGLDTSHLTPLARLSATSETSISSADLGYGSASPGIESSGTRTVTKKPFGFGGLFKRKDKTAVNVGDLDGNLLPFPQMAEVETSSPSSQLSNPPPSTREAPTPPSLIVECVSCLDDFTTPSLIKVSCHSYCKPCFQRLIANALETETHWPPKCCLNTIPTPLILPHLSTSTTKKYNLRAAEWSLPASSRIYCSSPTCSTFLPPHPSHSRTHVAKCPLCPSKTCTICRGPSHRTSACPSDPALLATEQLAEQEGWRRCYSCGALVEHNQGCRHMTCRCRAQFCYICGLKWRTCACSDAQLATIQLRAETRRTAASARERRERMEREEEEAAVAAVQAFVRAEEERAAVAAEAERRAEEERRARREEERVAGVHVRFAALGRELEDLSAVQRVAISQRHERETAALELTRREELDVLFIRHAHARDSLALESARMISEREDELEREYQARFLRQQADEERYLAELTAFWKSKEDGELRVRVAVEELVRDQERAFRAWDRWRRGEIERLTTSEEVRMRGLRGEFERETRAFEGRWRGDLSEGRRRSAVDGRWVDEVGRERRILLGEWEGWAYAGDV